MTILKRKIFDNLYGSWQRTLKTAKIFEDYKDFERNLSGFSKILESGSDTGIAETGSERQNYGLNEEKIIEIVSVRLDTTGDSLKM